jgi:hypothetical protein
VAFVRLEVSEERITSIISVERSSLLGMFGGSFHPVIIRATRHHIPKDSIFIVNAVKTSNLTQNITV